jgi:hypothetical protein
MAVALPLRGNLNPTELFFVFCEDFNFGNPIFKVTRSQNTPGKTILTGLTVTKLGISGNNKFLPSHYKYKSSHIILSYKILSY